MAKTMQVMERVIGQSPAVEKTQVISAGAELNIDESIPDASTDLEIAFSLDVSECKGIFILTDGAVLLETNDGSSPADSINLVADVPYFWHAASYHVLLFGTDITSIFLTNASGAAVSLKIFSISDPTP